MTHVEEYFEIHTASKNSSIQEKNCISLWSYKVTATYMPVTHELEGSIPPMTANFENDSDDGGAIETRCP